ncbi:MAG: hypothetical protein IKO93_17055, partial [Lentisphaeria bacterium]|nr:hypothetical protein [Lentisphaeria bacterium]
HSKIPVLSFSQSIQKSQSGLLAVASEINFGKRFIPLKTKRPEKNNFFIRSAYMGTAPVFREL